jgi:UDPglucose--hexose-1-phosphate uridylyltransferase
MRIRVISEAEHAIAFVPAFARFPYETWVIPCRAGADLTSLTTAERNDIASLLRQVLQRMDELWNLPMPYLMSINQAPLDMINCGNWTLRIEIWPTRRSRDKLKFLAGTELAAGVFASDVLPERAAAELRAVAM